MINHVIRAEVATLCKTIWEVKGDLQTISAYVRYSDETSNLVKILVSHQAL